MKNKEYKDRGLRQALQHRSEAAERMTLSEDFTDRLMERIEGPRPKPLSAGRGRMKRLPYWRRFVGAAAAASVVVLLTFHYLNHHEVTKVERPVVVKKTEKPLPLPNREGRTKSLPYGGRLGEAVAKVKEVSQCPMPTTAAHKTPTAVPATDSLDYYIDKIERELTQVDESLYIERMNKVIRADERLQRMVNSYILHTLDKEGRPQTAENMYNVKSEQDEE